MTVKEKEFLIEVRTILGYCYDCDYELTEEDEVCNNCGKKLDFKNERNKRVNAS